MGDPAGIGPEVLVKALADPDLRAAASFRIFGIEDPLRLAAERASVTPFWRRVGHRSELAGAAPPGTVFLVDGGPGLDAAPLKAGFRVLPASVGVPVS